MKTSLIIDEDLIQYLEETIDRTLDPTNKECAFILKTDPFNRQWKFKFKNNYGASIIKKFGSFGFEDDMFELAVLEWFDDGSSHLCYDTDITDNVIGHLTNEEVMDLLHRIKDLKKETKNNES